MIFNFLWENKKEMIKRTTLIVGVQLNLGINMIDIKAHILALKLKWVKKLVDGSEANWKLIPKSIINKLIDQNILWNKLQNKVNYLAEVHTINQVIPKS